MKLVFDDMEPPSRVRPRSAYPPIAVFASGVFLGGLALWVHFWIIAEREHTYLVSASPRDASEVTLAESCAGLAVRLQRDGEAGHVTLFRSMDTMWDWRTHRAVWAKDGSRFVVFRSLGVSGDDLLVMYDLRQRKLWSNISADGNHPTFTIDDMRALEWVQFPGIQPADRAGAAGGSQGREE